MSLENREDFVDLVAQAVIDRIEERNKIMHLVDLVAIRVLELQQAEATLHTNEVSQQPPSDKEKDNDEIK